MTLPTTAHLHQKPTGACNMTMTYRELLDRLNNMKDESLDQPVVTYSGDIDDTINVIDFHVNDAYNMGDPLETYPEDQFLLILA